MKMLKTWILFAALALGFYPPPIFAQTLGNGDADSNGVVNTTDLKYILNHWWATTGTADQWGDGLVNSLDYSYTRTKIIIPTPTLTPLQEVAPHNAQTDCWTVYSGHVYNVTGFFGLHPGGNSTLLNACGKDMTSIWNAVGSHTDGSTSSGKTAAQWLQTYYLH